MGGGGGGKGIEVGEEGGRLYTYRLHCHHQNYFCIKVRSDDSYFNVS